MRYKVGDKVKIREDLVHGTRYGVNIYFESMKLKGEVVEIIDILGKRYIVKGYEDWLLTEEMIEHNLDEADSSIEDLLDDLGEESIMVNCENVEDAVDFLELLYKKGYVWVNNKPINSKNYYGLRGNETVYNLYNKEVGLKYKRLPEILSENGIVYSYRTGRVLEKTKERDEMEGIPADSFVRLCDVKYNTAKMMAELTKNTSRHFRRVYDGLIVSANDKGDILWESGHDFLNTEHKWEEVAEKVSFRVAFRAWSEERKTICCKKRNGDTLWYRGTWELNYDFNSEDIAHGEWFINE